MTPRTHLPERLLVAGIAIVALAVASCSWWQAHPEAPEAVDAVVENGERLCFLVTDDQGEREICSSGADLARAIDAFAAALQRQAVTREFTGGSAPSVAVVPVDSPSPAPSSSVERVVP